MFEVWRIAKWISLFNKCFHEPLLKFPRGLFKDCFRFTQYPLKRYTKSTPNPLGNIREVIFSNEMLRKLFQKQQKSLERDVKIDNEYIWNNPLANILKACVSHYICWGVYSQGEYVSFLMTWIFKGLVDIFHHLIFVSLLNTNIMLYQVLYVSIHNSHM